jgi:hypothetical protein
MVDHDDDAELPFMLGGDPAPELGPDDEDDEEDAPEEEGEARPTPAPEEPPAA